MSLRSQWPTIPAGLCDAEVAVYDTLLEALKNRAVKGLKPPHLVVITDLAKDYDDLMAMVLLAELHRLGLVELEAFVANLEPARRRANFGRGALDLLGLQSIPIASGTKGTEKPYNLNDYEFEDCAFMGPQNRENFEAGESLLKRVCQRAVDENRKITLILLSSLMDISQFAHKHRQLLEDAVDRISIQGGVYRDKKGHLKADNLAANNHFSLDHAMHFTKFIQDTNIRTTVYTKVAAFATKIYADFFAELADTGHPLGIHLRKTQLAQDVNFYKATMTEGTRFRPFMTQQWFLKNRSTWFTNHSEDPAVEPYPPGTGREISDRCCGIRCPCSARWGWRRCPRHRPCSKAGHRGRCMPCYWRVSQREHTRREGRCWCLRRADGDRHQSSGEGIVIGFATKLNMMRTVHRRGRQFLIRPSRIPYIFPSGAFDIASCIRKRGERAARQQWQARQFLHDLYSSAGCFAQWVPQTCGINGLRHSYPPCVPSCRPRVWDEFFSPLITGSEWLFRPHDSVQKQPDMNPILMLSKQEPKEVPNEYPS